MDISLIEFIVYGLVGYTGVILLIISAFRETPMGKSQSIVRAIYMVLSITAVFILANSGLNINMESQGETITEVYDGVGALVSNSTSYGNPANPSQFILMNPIWIPFHLMLGVVMSIYAIMQILILLTKTD